MILQTRILRNSQLELVTKELSSLLKGLEVQIMTHGTHGRGGVEVQVSGQDERIALRFLEENIGFCPSGLDEVRSFSTFKGYVSDRANNGNELRLDVGPLSRNDIEVAVPLRKLQSQLSDGRKIALTKMVDLFALCKNRPLRLKILKVNNPSLIMEGELTEEQTQEFSTWVRSLSDRLLIFGSSLNEVKRCVKKSGVWRDIVRIESLGMFEQVVVCKLGTDAVGLIPKIGKALPTSTLSVFNPRKIVSFLGEDCFSFGF